MIATIERKRIAAVLLTVVGGLSSCGGPLVEPVEDPEGATLGLVKDPPPRCGPQLEAWGPQVPPGAFAEPRWDVPIGDHVTLGGHIELATSGAPYLVLDLPIRVEGAPLYRLRVMGARGLEDCAPAALFGKLDHGEEIALSGVSNLDLGEPMFDGVRFTNLAGQDLTVLIDDALIVVDAPATIFVLDPYAGRAFAGLIGGMIAPESNPFHGFTGDAAIADPSAEDRKAIIIPTKGPPRSAFTGQRLVWVGREPARIPREWYLDRDRRVLYALEREDMALVQRALSRVIRLPLDPPSMGGAFPANAALQPHDSYPWDSFGYRVAIEGEIAAVAKPRIYEGGAPFRPATVHLFHRTKGIWREEAQLTGGPMFGYALALSGDMLAVGDPSVDSVRIYERGEGEWREQVRFFASAGTRLGTSVAMDGGLVVAGAPGSGSHGAVYVLSRPAGKAWKLEAGYTSRDTQQLGETVAISGDIVVAGEANAAHFLIRSESGWRHEKLGFPEGGGWYNLVHGDTLLHAALCPMGDGYGSYHPPCTDALDIYRRKDGAWIFEERLWGSPGRNLGCGLALAKDLVLAGECTQWTERAVTAVHARNGTAWTRAGEIYTWPLEHFPLAIAVTRAGDTAIIGGLPRAARPDAPEPAGIATIHPLR